MFSLEYIVRPVGLGARPGVRNRARGRQRHAGHAPRGEYAAGRDLAGRAVLNAAASLHLEDQPAFGNRRSAHRQRLDPHCVDARGDPGGVEGHAGSRCWSP